IASAFTDMPSGLRNSSLSTSPGWVVTRSGVAALSLGLRLVVVDDFDISQTLTCLGPCETDAPLVVDADRMLSAPVSCERFEPVRRRRSQIVKITRLMQHVEPA